MIERFEPRGGAMSLRQMMDRLLQDAFIMPSAGQMATGEGAPLAVNVYEEGDNLVVEAQLAGVQPDELDVTIEGDLLTIRAEMETEQERRERNYLVREFSRGSFARTLRLPATIDTNAVQTSFEHGVLRLMFPKSEQARHRRIPISSGTQRGMEGRQMGAGQEAATGRQAAGGRAGAATEMRSGMQARSQVQQGMLVLGSDGEEIGRVKEVRDRDFLVDRPLRRDVYVPFDAIDSVEGDRITLNVAAGRIDDMGWEHPEILPTGEQSGRPGTRG